MSRGRVCPLSRDGRGIVTFGVGCNLGSGFIVVCSNGVNLCCSLRGLVGIIREFGPNAGATSKERITFTFMNTNSILSGLILCMEKRRVSGMAFVPCRSGTSLVCDLGTNSIR